MKTFKLLFVSAMLIGAQTAFTEPAILVTIAGFDKTEKNEVMSRAELTEFKKTLTEESKVFTAAMSLAKQNWTADGTQTDPFPATKLSKRAIVREKAFQSPDLAREQLSKIQNRETEQLIEEQKKMKKLSREAREKAMEKAAKKSAKDKDIAKAADVLAEAVAAKLAPPAAAAATKETGKSAGK